MTELLADIFNTSKSGTAVRSGNLTLMWDKVVSGEIARFTEAVKVSRQVLYVEVKSPVWAQELNFLKPEIMQKLNQKAGYPAIKDIRFKAGG